MAVTDLSTLMRDIGEALRLDNDNCEKEAYKKYVSCTYNITTNLILGIRSADGDVVVNGQSVRQVKLAQQCVDRLAVLSEKLDGSGSPAKFGSQKSLELQQLSPRGISSATSPTTTQPPPRTSQSAPRTSQSAPQGPQDKQGSPVGGRLAMTVPSLPPENNPHVVQLRSQSLTPMEKARRQNQSLMAAYKARMARKNKADFNAFSYSLTIQRKMAENLAIAQAQEIQLAKKIEARNQRLEEQAAKRFASAAPLGMSKEEQEQRQIYKRILHYENEAQWLQAWRQKVDLNPEDPILISQLVTEILRCSDHPITELLRQYQFKVYQLLYPLVAEKHQHLDRIKVPLDPDLWPSQEEVLEMLKTSQVLPQLAGGLGDGRGHKRRSRKSSRRGRLSSHEEDDPEREDSSERKESSTPASEHDDLSIKCNKDVENNESSNSDHFSDPLGVIQNKCIEEEVTNKETWDSKDNVKGNNPEDNDSINPEDNKSIKPEDNEGINNEDDKEQSSDSETGVVREIASGLNEKTADQVSGIIERVKEDLHLAVNKGESLATQMSWEHRQAQLLMRQVTKDYENYEIDNFDDLFDSDDDDSDDEASEHIKPVSTRVVSGTDTNFQKPEDQSQVLSRSTSHQPQRDQSSLSEDPTAFQSLPANIDLGQQKTTEEEKRKVNQLSREAYNRHLKTICDDIHNYLEKVQVMLTIAYEALDTPVGRDQCIVSLEEPFFKAIWKTLFKLFRVVNHQEELVLACVMSQSSASSPRDLKVHPKFCLEGSSPPYLPAISELGRIREHYTMLSKLECIVKVCRLICECVDEYYKKSNTAGKKSPSMGADDLLPVFSYVIIQSALPQLVSECQAMTEFIHEGYMMGEEGYCLTTLRTALTYVSSLMCTGQGSPEEL